MKAAVGLKQKSGYPGHVPWYPGYVPVIAWQISHVHGMPTFDLAYPNVSSSVRIIPTYKGDQRAIWRVRWCILSAGGRVRELYDFTREDIDRPQVRCM